MGGGDGQRGAGQSRVRENCLDLDLEWPLNCMTLDRLLPTCTPHPRQTCPALTFCDCSLLSLQYASQIQLPFNKCLTSQGQCDHPKLR